MGRGLDKKLFIIMISIALTLLQVLFQDNFAAKTIDSSATTEPQSPPVQPHFADAPALSMVDPLTALMHAVQVMNLLKTLILRTIREREETGFDPRPIFMCSGSSHENDLDEDTGCPFSLGCSALTNIDEEIMQETFMAPFNSPNRKGSPNVYSADKLGEVIELSERQGLINSSECEECLSDDLSSCTSFMSCKDECKEPANFMIVHPDDDETEMGNKVVEGRNQCSIIVRPKRSNKYQRLCIGHTTSSIKW